MKYTIPKSGEYRPRQRSADAGRHLCVVDPALSRATLCPRPVPAADLASGRFTQGREICVRGTIYVVAQAEDGDSHVQLKVREPLPYPNATIGYSAFGATTEIAPPLKDPARPGGGLADPKVGADVIVIGTYRYDNGHGWFEVHPAKTWWPAAAP